jgi:hypothetical protein
VAPTPTPPPTPTPQPTLTPTPTPTRTPSPTPTPTLTPTPTPTPTATPVPTPTPTATPVSCVCKQGTIQDNNSFSYTDCAGVFQSGGAEQGSEVCVDINQSYSANIGNLIDFVSCQCS